MAEETGLFVHAPFLATYGPSVLAAAIGALLMFFLMKRTPEETSQKPPSPSKPSAVNNKSAQNADEDNFVFLDTDLAGNMEDVGDQMEEEEELAPHVPYTARVYPPDEMVQRSREFYEEMNHRRSVRFFSDKPIPREVVENIIRAAGTSPSGAHTEPWTYVAVWDKDTKSQIRTIIEDEEELNYQKRMGDKWVNDIKVLRTNHEKPYLDLAPCLVIVFKQSYGIKADGSRRTHYYNELSTAISTGIFLCAVQMAGLVTLTSTPMNAGPRLRKLLNRPSNEKVILLMPLGYAADDASVPGFGRKPLEDIMVTV